VLPPLADESNHVENIFLENAETMDVFLTHATEEETALFTHNLYMDMYKAHSEGVVYGDRWSENILITPKGNIVNIDFDIEIFGSYAKEFEAAQVAYYILAGAKSKVIPQLAKLLSVPYANLDLRYIETFLRGHAKHFDSNKKYGNLKEEVNVLVELMHKEYESYRRG
jgi:tRNA A-37 threonylcarbamoyl transferase component Bud32